MRKPSSVFCSGKGAQGVTIFVCPAQSAHFTFHFYNHSSLNQDYSKVPFQAQMMLSPKFKAYFIREAEPKILCPVTVLKCV